MRYSIVIPAHNEEKYIGKCLESIRLAKKPKHASYEIIVVLNRCTDATERIARRAGARIVKENARNMARIRNAGAVKATGEVILTIDADSWMSRSMIVAIDRALRSKKYVGGGVDIKPERLSLGIRATMFLLRVMLFVTRLGGGLYWCLRKDFEAIGGFNEQLPFGEDLDFALRLKRHGKKTNRAFIVLHDAFIRTSCRKFDAFGDWFMVKMFFWDGIKAWREMRNGKHSFADRIFYDFQH